MEAEGCYSYYGQPDCPKPIRNLSEDLLMELDRNMRDVMKEMETNIKRHITECKREIIRELMGDRQISETQKKEVKDGNKTVGRNKKRSVK